MEDSGLGSHTTSTDLSSTTRFSLSVPASTGFQSRRRTSQRGVIAPYCGAVFVTFASWNAAASPSVCCALPFAVTNHSPVKGREAPGDRRRHDVRSRHHARRSRQSLGLSSPEVV